MSGRVAVRQLFKKSAGADGFRGPAPLVSLFIRESTHWPLLSGCGVPCCICCCIWLSF